MKNVYIKTSWVDNKTPINAANLNKIENAISDLYANSLSPSEIVEGNGISIAQTSDKKMEISVASNVMKSDTTEGLEVVQGIPSTMENGRVYIVLDPETKKMTSIIINGVKIYEVE